MKSYKLFESLSKFFAEKSRKEGFRVVGFAEATKMIPYIGRYVIVEGEKCKLTSIEPIKHNGFMKYYGVIERIRGKKTFVSRKLVSTLKPA